MTNLNFNFRRILKLELFKNNENEAIRSLEEPLVNFIALQLVILTIFLMSFEFFQSPIIVTGGGTHKVGA